MARKITMQVSDEEHFSRWVYAPRFLTADGSLNEKFIWLRPNIKERGISGQLCDRIDYQTIVSDGMRFVHANDDGKLVETLKYIAIAQVGDIRAIALQNDKVDVIEVPSVLVHEHAEIVFVINGERVDATSKDAKLFYYYDELKILLGKNLMEV